VPRDWRAECGWTDTTVVAGVVGPMTEARHERELEALLHHLDAATRDALGVVLLGGPPAGRGDLAGVKCFRAGFVHDIPRALAGLELLLHPGGAEGLGTAVVEAMALRVPTLAFAAGGVSEIVESERNGLLVPVGDAVGFAAALASLTLTPERRRALGEAGPERAAAFSSDRMVDRTIAVYRDLIDQKAV
jgi:glycosyltransferase involved in cell wall biosynthesis